MANFKNQSEFYIQEVVSAMLGRCYTVCYLRQMTLIDSVTIKLNPTWSYKVFIHLKNEELWLGVDGSFRTAAASFFLGKLYNLNGAPLGKVSP